MNNWELPKSLTYEFQEKKNKYCLCIPVINEGEKIQKQLTILSSYSEQIDIIVLDGGSTDGSLEHEFLEKNGVRTMLIKKDSGKLSAQLRMGFAYAIKEHYEGVITVDGNNKDSMDSIPLFIEALDQGYDFVQGSRYIHGGCEINTPLSRKLAIKLIHAPWISMLSGFRYTDTTNGFRAHSTRFLMNPKVNPFRNIFETYELLAYLSVKAPNLGYRVKEVPVTRAYPIGKVPTKISPIKGNVLLIKILFNLLLKKYDVNEHDLPEHGREVSK